MPSGAVFLDLSLAVRIHDQLQASHWSNKKIISHFFDASGNKNMGATIGIGPEIRCLPYVGYFLPAKKIKLN